MGGEMKTKLWLKTILSIALIIALLFICDKAKSWGVDECDAMCEILKEEFERLTNNVRFSVSKGHWYRGPGFPATFVSIYKTQTGINALYKPWRSGEFMRAELSIEEWQSFLKSLYKYLNKDFGNENWKDEYEKGEKTVFTRTFEAYYSREFSPDISLDWKAAPFDWDGVEKLMTNMAATIMERSEKPFEDELKAEYQKKFGEPISDFELSTRMVSFWIEKNSCYSFVFLDEIGGLAEECNIRKDISISEWLDFVRALYKNGADKLENKYGEPPSDDYWVIDIYSSGRLDVNRTEGFGAYPENWNGLNKVLEDMVAK